MNNSYGVGLGIRCARDLEDNSRMQARSFYMNALVEMGAQKFKKANISINKALEINPDDQEYESLKNLIERRKN